MLRGEPRVRRWVRLAGDLALGVAVFYVAFWIRIHLPVPFTDRLLPPDRIGFFHTYWPLVVLSQVALLYFFGLYDPPQPRSGLDTARRLAPAVVLQVVALGAFFFLAERTFPRSVLVIFAGLGFLALLAWRLAIAAEAAPAPVRVAIVGSGAGAVELAGRIREHGVHGLTVAGWVPAPGEPGPGSGGGRPELGPCLGTLEDLPQRVAAGEIDEVVLADTESAWKTRFLDALARVSGEARGSVLVLPGAFESLIGRMRYRWVRDLPLIEVIRDSEWRLFRPVKRAFDLAAGSLLLALALPALLACALLVRLTSAGPVLYRQERVGRGLQPFTLWKLRTMAVGAEGEREEVLARPGDPRLTPAGALLRRLRLDELPQLFNVLGGSMSLVGPRPERPGFVARYLEEIPGYAERFSVAPGLTGLAQINGEYHSSPQNKLRYDLAYVANWSLWLDLSILVRTVKIVLTSRGV
jgi:exopolysaccharide biosynthesis polyprenyl glycosylphosphotransferase